MSKLSTVAALVVVVFIAGQPAAAAAVSPPRRAAPQARLPNFPIGNLSPLLPTRKQAEKALLEVAGLAEKKHGGVVGGSSSSGCDSQTQAIGPCSVDYTVCYGIYDWQWQYTATACTSDGICGGSGEHDSSDGAAFEATFNLFQQRPSCACDATVIPLGNCTFGVSGCFEFASSDDVESKQVSFFANVTDVQSGVWADFCCTNNATDAVKNAFVGLSQKESLLKCY